MSYLSNEKLDVLRYERKIALLNGSPGDVAKNLYLMNFHEEYDRRRVSSIYYDTKDLRSYRQNIDGVFNREKYRIRYYNECSPCALEIKIKRGMLMGKLIRPLDVSSDHLNSNPFEFIKYFSEYSDERLLPIAYVSYLRRYFKNSIGIRCTIDTDIATARILGDMKSDLIPNNYEVIEFKYAPHLDDYFRNFCFPRFATFGYRLTKSSKYVRAVRQTI